MSYLAVPLSERRKTAVRSGSIGLRTVFTEPEDGMVLRVTTNYSTGRVEVVQVNPGDVPENELPRINATIHLPTATLPEFDLGDLGLRAVSEGRSFLALKFNPPTLIRSEYPARELSEALSAIQEFAESLVQEEFGSPTSRGHLSQQVVEDAELSVIDLQAASFVAILAPSLRSTDAPRLELEMPATTSALKHIGAILESCSEESQLRDSISNLGIRSVTKLRNLLELTLDQNTSLGVYIAVPHERVSEIHISTKIASSSLLILTERDEILEEIQLSQAILIGVNLRTWAFELNDESREPHKFSGKILDSARQEINGLPTGDGYRYDAIIIAQTEFSDITDEVKVRFTLKSIVSRSST
jgi:hypothetical protein